MTIVITQPRHFLSGVILILTVQKTGYSFTKYGHWKNGAQDKIKDLSIFTTTKEIILNVTLVTSREAQHLIK